MDKVRIERLAQTVEQLHHSTRMDAPGFNMKEWMRQINGESDCGTVCCIGGTAALLMGKPFASGDEIANWLGLSARKTEALFFPYDVADWDEITPALAASVIRNLGETGNVEWPSDMLWTQFDA